jgi:hypothetical protein
MEAVLLRIQCAPSRYVPQSPPRTSSTEAGKHHRKSDARSARPSRHRGARLRPPARASARSGEREVGATPAGCAYRGTCPAAAGLLSNQLRDPMARLRPAGIDGRPNRLYPKASSPTVPRQPTSSLQLDKDSWCQPEFAIVRMELGTNGLPSCVAAARGDPRLPRLIIWMSITQKLCVANEPGGNE